MKTDKEVPEDRKIRKPLIEKKRRARINESLEKLKNILLECDPETVNKKSAKLEKADILEMTVKYLENVRKTQEAMRRQQYVKNFVPVQRQYFSYRQNFVMPFINGSQYYYIQDSSSPQKNYSLQQYPHQESIWRPW